MKMLFGAIVVDGRGKIGGQVASKNRGGAYLRTKVSPTQPRTAAQLGVRSLLASLSQTWRTLTEAQRESWNAATIDYKKSNVFGDLKQATGFNLFQRINNNLTQLGLDLILVPPLPSGNDSFTNLVLTYHTATPVLSLAYDVVGDGVSYAKVMATAPVSAGKSFVKSEYRQIAILDIAAVSPANLLAAYTAKFGTVGSLGQKIFVKLIPVNESGQDGVGASTSTVSAS